MIAIYSESDWPHGLRCIDCERLFIEGQPISERPYAMDQFAAEPMVCIEIVCAECALGSHLKHES